MRKSVISHYQTFQSISSHFDIKKSLSQTLIPNLTTGKSYNPPSNFNINDIFKMIIEETKTSPKSVDSFHSIKILEI